MILIIDNYDSFVYNLARYCEELNVATRVVRNDQISLAEIEDLAPTGLILSPGPCGPDQAGICLSLVKQFAGQVPILGVCLGHQVIAQAFGGRIIRAKRPMHGKASLMSHCQRALFEGLKTPLKVGRYHSLSVDLPEKTPFSVDGRSEDGEIMALSIEAMGLFGVQFHPESILSEHGHHLLGTFLKLCGETPDASLV